MRKPIAAGLAAGLLALLALPGTAPAEERQACEVPNYLLFGSNELKHVAEAVAKNRRLTIAVVGTGSSILAGPDGPPSPTRHGSRHRSRSGYRTSRSKS